MYKYIWLDIQVYSSQILLNIDQAKQEKKRREKLKNQYRNNNNKKYTNVLLFEL